VGDIDRVNAYLGYVYSFAGEVVAGDKIGRSIGFPTANLQLKDDRKLLPAPGVYAVKVLVGQETFGGMLNIGVRPTVSRSGIVRIEVNLFDFGQDIYGKEIRVSLLARIRGERKFDTLQELSAQLSRDKKDIETVFSAGM
ncbi:MAG: riboflavin kinase, partial [Odoribacter sp.]|nr:riboflavin kinase [Odoribacter sp.]